MIKVGICGQLGGGGGVGNKGLYEGLPNWRQSFLREIRTKRHQL
jgi:hypothetical protein